MKKVAAKKSAEKPAKKERTLEIQLNHPILHSGIEYGRGVHVLPESLAKQFLTYKDRGSNGNPIAQLPDQNFLLRKGSVTKVNYDKPFQKGA